ncbi:MAG: hypothetical protein M0Z41_05055 [Peptococcaceae bacterium]|nr:hypothetical protein [Peptococcaceae bacterium]
MGISFISCWAVHNEVTLGRVYPWEDVSCHGRVSGVVFDYLDAGAFVPGQVSPRVQRWLDNVGRVGEPVCGGLDPDSLAAELAPLGLAVQEDLAPAGIEERYFRDRTDGYQATGHVHFVRAVTI